MVLRLYDCYIFSAYIFLIVLHPSHVTLNFRLKARQQITDKMEKIFGTLLTTTTYVKWQTNSNND